MTGAPMTYPVGAYAGMTPRGPRRWIIGGVAVVAAAVLAGGGWWWTHRSGASATGTVQADGSTLVDTQGVHIVTPAGWTVVSTTPSALAKAGQSVVASNPQMAAAVQALQNGQQSALRFLAFGPPSGGFVSDADVLVTQTPVPLTDVVAASSQQLSASGATHVQESPATTSGGSAEQLTFQLPLKLPQGGTVSLNVEQVYESKGSQAGILTLETTKPSEPEFAGIISSFHLT